MKVLYLKGSRSEIDAAITQQLLAVAPDLAITPVGRPADVLVEIRQAPGWQALFVSPTLAQHDALVLIASLRRDRSPIAIVPVVEDTQQERYAAAVSSGADDVLVRRGESLVNVAETIERIRQGQQAFSAEPRRRLRVLYAGRDPLVWGLIEQVPFVKAERVSCGADGSVPMRVGEGEDAGLRGDAVVIDEQPDEAHPLQVLKSIKAQAPNLPAIVLTSSHAADIATAALELGADDTVLKTGIFRRRLLSALGRVHQRIELQFQQAEITAREQRIRQIVEHVPAAIAVIAGDGAVQAMNAEALHLVGARKPREVVGRDFRTLVAPDDHEAVTDVLRRVTRGEAASLDFVAETLTGERIQLRLRGAVLERDAKGTRGTIASLAPLQPAAGALPAPAGPPSDTAGMALTIAELERQCEELRATRAREAAERHVLEQQLEINREGLRQRAELQRRLEQREARLQEVEAARAAQQQEWQATQLVVATTAEQLEASHQRIAELEAAAAARRDERQFLQEARDRDAREWLAARGALEGRLREAEAALRAAGDQNDAARASVEQDAHALRDTLAAERAAWEQMRDGWTRDRAALEAGARERDAAHVAARAEWDEARTRLEAEWADREAARQYSDESLRSLQADYADLVRTLADERGDRERDTRERDALRATVDQHDRTRAALELRAREADREAERRGAELQDLRSVLEARLAETSHRLDEAGHEIARLHVTLQDERARVLDEQNRRMTSSVVGYALTTRDGHVRRCNDRFARLFGYQDAADLMNRVGAQPFAPLDTLADDTGLLGEQGLDRTAICLERLDGRAIRVHQSAIVLPVNQEGESLVERLFVEVEVASPLEALQARRLEEVGSLTNAMAPGLEQLAAEVEQRIRDLRHRLAHDAAAAGEVTACATLAAQTAALVRQLAAFGRRQVGAVATVDLNDTIRQAEPMLAQLVGEYIGFDIRLGPAAQVTAHPQDLDQLLTSLVIFGRDALPAGGSLRLETAAVAQDDARSDEFGPGTRLTLTASGYGIHDSSDAPALALVTRRAGAELRLSGEAGWQLHLHAIFPRCARRTH